MRWSTAKSKRLRHRPKPPVRPAADVARAFVTELGRGRRPSIEAALDQAARDEWPGLLRTLLVAEIGDRRSRGDAPTAREYLPRFPAHTEIVRAVLPEPPTPVVAPPTEPAAEAPKGPLPEWVREASYPESPAVVVAPPAAIPLAIVLPAEPPAASPVAEPGQPAARPRRRVRLLMSAAVIVLAGGAVALALVGLPKRHPDEPPPSPAPPSPTPAPKPAPAKPLIPLKTPAADPERDLAEWVLSLAGRGELQPDGGNRRPFSAEVPPPKVRFAVTGVVLPPEAARQWTPADLSRLAGHSKLTSVQLHASGPLTEADLAPLAGRPLRTLELHGGPVRVSGGFCASFPDLEVLALTDAPDFTDTDLAAVGPLPRLKTLTLNSPKLTAAGFRALRNPALKGLSFGESVLLTADHIRVLQRPGIEEFESAAGMTDDAFLEFALIPDLKRVRLAKTALTDAGLRAVVGLGKLEGFRADGSSITGPGLEHLAERKGLKILDLSGGKLSNDSLGTLLALPVLRELRLAGNPITDAGAPLLAQLDRVEVLDLGETAITDETLRHLAKHATLKSLVVTNTRVTAPAVRAFEAATPGCKVVSGRRR